MGASGEFEDQDGRKAIIGGTTIEDTTSAGGVMATMTVTSTVEMAVDQAEPLNARPPEQQHAKYQEP